MNTKNNSENKIIKSVTIVNLILNCIVFGVLLTLGILAKSRTVIFTSIDSILDIIVSIVLWIFAVIASKKEDEDHPYGHERFESISVVIMGIILIVTASNLLLNGGQNLYLVLAKKESLFNSPSKLAIPAIGIKLVIKIILFIISFTCYKKAKFISLKAIYRDAIIDITANVLAVISVILAHTRFTYFEPIGAILVAIFILYNGIKLLRDSVSQVVDKSLDKDTIKVLKDIILSISGVCAIDLLKTRQFGIKLYVDLEIAVDENLTVKESHSIAEQVHKQIKERFKEVKYCMVHINPYHKGENYGEKDCSN